MIFGKQIMKTKNNCKLNIRNLVSKLVKRSKNKQNSRDKDTICIHLERQRQWQWYQNTNTQFHIIVYVWGDMYRVFFKLITGFVLTTPTNKMEQKWIHSVKWSTYKWITIVNRKYVEDTFVALKLTEKKTNNNNKNMI